MFTSHELQSSTWVKLRDHLQERLTALRCQNDGDLDEMATARLRGRVACLKEILALGTPGPKQAEADTE
jgi:hypothetical protein